MRQSVLPRWLVALLVAVATWLLPSPLRACADTIPLQAQQTATRTVALTWNPTSPEVVTTILRRYPGEQTERTVATTTGSSYIDHHGRAVCDDTVYYVIRQTVGGLVDQGFAAVNVIDMDPTAAAAWGVVSVDEQQQTVTLQWEASADTDIMGYMVMEGTPSIVIDTVFGRLNTQYVALQCSSDTVYHFRICAFDTCRQASALTEACNNVVLTLESQPCSRSVTARWNRYENMPDGVDQYELWVSEDGGAFRRESVTAADGTLQSEFTVAEQTMTLQAYIKVVGSHQYASYSNRSEVAFSTAERPAYFYLRKVSTSDDGSVVTVEAQTDPQFPGTDYKVYRAVGDGPAAVVAHCQPTTAGLLRWQDFSAHPLEQIYCYYLGVEDGCGRNEMYTRTGATLQLLIAEQGSSVAVAWNPYDGWEGATSYELLMQQADATTWTLVANTVATEAVVDIDGMHAGGSCRFKVVAAESSASRYQQGDTLQSAVFSHSPHVTLWMPNAFTPTESTNNLFGPCFQAIDANGYEFHIFNRQGLVVFSSRNPEERWDGRREGLLMPAGSYVYYITFRQGDGTVQQLKGTVTLIY